MSALGVHLGAQMLSAGRQPEEAPQVLVAALIEHVTDLDTGRIAPAAIVHGRPADPPGGHETSPAA